MLPRYEVDASAILVHRKNKPTERWECANEREAHGRVRFIEEAFTWLGTPFIDCADVKGPKGAVDCVMMMARASIDSGLREPFDPRPYSPRHMLYRSDELFIKYLTEKLGCVEVEKPVVGDILAYFFGRCHAHGAILIDSEELIHASGAHGMCVISPLKEPLLKWMDYKHTMQLPRPVKYFSYSHTWKI